MVQVSQTEDTIKIVIELNRLLNKKPDIVVLSNYIKFNNPPIFFERYLADEIDESASYCRIFKKEARIVLMKKTKGLWPEIFLELSKEEMRKRRHEIEDQLIKNNQQKDKEAEENFAIKKRTEIEKEVKRDTARHDKLKMLEEEACRECLKIDVRASGDNKELKETEKPSIDNSTQNIRPMSAYQNKRESIPVPLRRRQIEDVRTAGKISISFSNFKFSTPKRESQEGRLK